MLALDNNFVHIWSHDDLLVEGFEFGQEDGIRTRTVSFTGRDAAGYTTILLEPLVGLAPSACARPPYEFTKLALSPRKWQVALVLPQAS